VPALLADFRTISAPPRCDDRCVACLPTGLVIRAAAIANAVDKATGGRIRSLPISIEKLLEH
jgi:hypothetical protein